MTHFEKMLPALLAKVIPPREADESGVEYETRIEVAREAFDAFGPRDAIEQMLALQAVGAHYAAIAALQTAIQPDTDQVTVSRARADATKMGREIRSLAKAIEHRQQPAAPARRVKTTKIAEEAMKREPEPVDEPDVVELAPDLTEERLGGYARRRRILDSDPVQAFWTTHHPIEVDIDAAWSNAIRAGLLVIEDEDARNGIKAHAT